MFWLIIFSLDCKSSPACGEVVCRARELSMVLNMQIPPHIGKTVFCKKFSPFFFFLQTTVKNNNKKKIKEKEAAPGLRCIFEQTQTGMKNIWATRHSDWIHNSFEPFVAPTRDKVCDSVTVVTFRWARLFLSLLSPPVGITPQLKCVFGAPCHRGCSPCCLAPCSGEGDIYDSSPREPGRRA